MSTDKIISAVADLESGKFLAVVFALMLMFFTAAGPAMLFFVWTEVSSVWRDETHKRNEIVSMFGSQMDEMNHSLREIRRTIDQQSGRTHREAQDENMRTER